jgi:hypothetical protein
VWLVHLLLEQTNWGRRVDAELIDLWRLEAVRQYLLSGFLIVTLRLVSAMHAAPSPGRQ